MKYENPKCEIVVLNSVDCLTGSESVKESPMESYPAKYGRNSCNDNYAGTPNY